MEVQPYRSEILLQARQLVLELLKSQAQTQIKDKDWQGGASVKRVKRT